MPEFKSNRFVIGQIINDQVSDVIDQILQPKLNARDLKIRLLGIKSDGTVNVEIKGKFHDCPTYENSVRDTVVSTIQENVADVRQVTITEQAVSDELILEGLKILRKSAD